MQVLLGSLQQVCVVVLALTDAPFGIPATAFWIYVSASLLFVVGFIKVLSVCLLLNKKARVAATTLGITIVLTVLAVYLPMLLQAPTDIDALNYFFDTMLFGGTILLWANALDGKTGNPISKD